jgi:hypothetical protein
MKRIVFLGYYLVILAGCGGDQTNSDATMRKAANAVFQDYVIEYRIDSTLFGSPIIEDYQDSLKSYKWLARNSQGDTVGVQVLVKRKHGLKSEMILVGDKDAWLIFLREHDPNSKDPKAKVGSAT